MHRIAIQSGDGAETRPALSEMEMESPGRRYGRPPPGLVVASVLRFRGPGDSQIGEGRFVHVSLLCGGMDSAPPVRGKRRKYALGPRRMAQHVYATGAIAKGTVRVCKR